MTDGQQTRSAALGVQLRGASLPCSLINCPATMMVSPSMTLAGPGRDTFCLWLGRPALQGDRCLRDPTRCPWLHLQGLVDIEATRASSAFIALPPHVTLAQAHVGNWLQAGVRGRREVWVVSQ